MNAEMIQDRRASLSFVVALTALVGVLAYCDFPVEWLVNSQLSPLRSYVSELAVAFEPASVTPVALETVRLPLVIVPV